MAKFGVLSWKDKILLTERIGTTKNYFFLKFMHSYFLKIGVFGQALLKNGQPYHDRSVDYEELSVKKNAPRWIKMLKKHGFLPSDSTAVGLSTVTV